MKHNIQKGIYLLAFFCIYTIVSTRIVEATPVISFSFQPVNLVLQAQQGSDFNEDVLVGNNNTKLPIQPKFYIMNFKPINGSGAVSFYTTNSSTTNMADWITIGKTSTTIPPNGKEYETLEFHIPTYIQSGTYTGVMFIQTTPGQVNGSTSQITGRGGINIILTITKNKEEYSSLYKKVVVKDFIVPPVSFAHEDFSGTLQNTSPFALSVTNKIHITTLLGGTVSSHTYVDIDILPNSYRYLDGVHKDVSYPLGIGVYRVDMTIHDNLKNTSYTITKYFTVVSPLCIIIGICIFVLCIGIVLYGISRKKRRLYR